MKGLIWLLAALLLTVPAEAKKRRRRAAPARPVSVYTREGGPNVQAHSASVVDLNSGEELFAKNPDEVRPIASISKLMAMLVVLERNLDLNATTMITDSDTQIARGGARSRLLTGMIFTNRDLLHAALMASDNRAVPALGRATGLDPQQMVAAMNKKAADLGLKRTSFGDPVGLDSRNRSTARDVVLLVKAAAKQPLLAEITQKPTYVARAVNRPGYVVEYVNTDVIARSGKLQVITGKTGYTDLALYCLGIAVRMVPGRDVAMVFLGAVGKMTRFGDVTRVAQWITEKKKLSAIAPVVPTPAAMSDTQAVSAQPRDAGTP